MATLADPSAYFFIDVGKVRPIPVLRLDQENPAHHLSHLTWGKTRLVSNLDEGAAQFRGCIFPHSDLGFVGLETVASRTPIRIHTTF